MADIRKKYNRIYFIIVVLGFILCIMYYHSRDIASMDSIMSHIQGEAVVYSEESGIFNESLSISLELNNGFPSDAEIYYTINSSNPTINSKKYAGSIELKITDQLKRYEVKTVIYYRGEYSEVFEKEYILCKNTDNDYGLDTIYITTRLKNLYDYETGIFTKGKTYDEYRVNGDSPRPGYPYGNYDMRGEEWIRDAHLIMFNADGESVINDDIGIGVSGGTSSAMDVKSIKIYADEKYGSKEDKFQIDLKKEKKGYLSNVTEYNSLRLRSGSQDMDLGNIRSSVVSALANGSNFDGCTESRRSLVFLNGDFYGIFDIQQNYSDSFLARHFNLSDPDKIEKVKGGESVSFEQMQLLGLFDTDLNNEEERKKLEAQIDMDNYLLYYAIELLCGNTDWPQNGFEMWRYVGTKDKDNVYSDGRWRFLLFDVDLSFPIDSTPLFFQGCKDEQFDAIMQGKNRAANSTFVNVMQSVYYRDKFITILCDLLNTSFSSENMLKIINMENNKIKSAREDFYSDEYNIQTELCLEQMRQYALKRPAKIEECIARYFGFVDKYVLNLDIPDGIEIYWNNEKFYAGELYTCEYYRGVQLTFNQDAYPGYEFKYWLINDRLVYGSTLTITDSMISDGGINIKPVLERKKDAQIIISEIYSRGTADWIKLTNVGGSETELSRYYLTDEEKNFQQYQLPRTVLKKGESIVIHGSKNRERLGDYICNFSLSEYETLILSDGERILDQVSIPRTAGQESYRRYDNSNQWIFSGINK